MPGRRGNFSGGISRAEKGSPSPPLLPLGPATLQGLQRQTAPRDHPNSHRSSLPWPPQVPSVLWCTMRGLFSSFCGPQAPLRPQRGTRGFPWQMGKGAAARGSGEKAHSKTNRPAVIRVRCQNSTRPLPSSHRLGTEFWQSRERERETVYPLTRSSGTPRPINTPSEGPRRLCCR